MRYDLLIGLNDWSKRYVRGARRSTIAHISGAFKPRVGALRSYEIADGSVVFDFVQAAPWCKGPNYYLALRRADGTVIQESLWDRDEMC